MITTCLIISHLVSDFLLQPAQLIKWKMNSFKGTIFHVIVFIIISLLILYPYLGRWEIWTVVFLIGIVHFFTDQAKINTELKNDPSDIPFISDQGIHYLSLVIGGQLADSLNIEACYSLFNGCLEKNIFTVMAVMLFIYLIYCAKLAFMHKTKKKIFHKIAIFTLVYLVYFGTVMVLFQ